MAGSIFNVENVNQCIAELGSGKLKTFNSALNVYDRFEEVYRVYEDGGDWKVEAAVQAGGQATAILATTVGLKITHSATAIALTSTGANPFIASAIYIGGTCFTVINSNELSTYTEDSIRNFLTNDDGGLPETAILSVEKSNLSNGDLINIDQAVDFNTDLNLHINDGNGVEAELTRNSTDNTREINLVEVPVTENKEAVAKTFIENLIESDAKTSGSIKVTVKDTNDASVEVNAVDGEVAKAILEEIDSEVTPTFEINTINSEQEVAYFDPNEQVDLGGSNISLAKLVSQAVQRVSATASFLTNVGENILSLYGNGSVEQGAYSMLASVVARLINGEDINAIAAEVSTIVLASAGAKAIFQELTADTSVAESEYAGHMQAAFVSFIVTGILNDGDLSQALENTSVQTAVNLGLQTNPVTSGLGVAGVVQTADNVILFPKKTAMIMAA